ncbi:hypothetical protein DIPPA_18765 [Diplonema papillatum]|nr:hypothetical protein DIPPA_18765 [Diplonema papillatum]
MCSLILAATCAAALASVTRQPFIRVTPPGITGAANMQMSLRFLGEGEEVWHTSASWAHVPEWLRLVSTAHGEGILLEKDTVVEYRCPKAAVECELFVFQYRCNGCSYNDGGMPAFLQGKGWTSFQCAPKFRLKAGGFEHPTLGFRMVADKDTETLLTIDEDTEFVAFAMDTTHIGCDKYTNQAACDASTKGRCEWEAGVCELRLCGPTSWGPNRPPTCSTHCVGVDLPLV